MTVAFRLIATARRISTNRNLIGTFPPTFERLPFSSTSAAARSLQSTVESTLRVPLPPVCAFRIPSRLPTLVSTTPLHAVRTMASAAFQKHKYPATRRDESVVDDYHGTVVADPYRWLEDPNAADTKAFVDAQNDVTNTVLAQCETRSKFNERMTELFDYPKYTCPFRRGDYWLYYYNTGLQPQSVLYVQDTLDGPARVLLDPNTLSADGTCALSSTAFSKDGAYIAYGLSDSGSDWQTVHVKAVADGRKLDDVLKWAKFTSLAWTHDNSGFFYNRYPEPTINADGTETDINLHQKVYYHALGTPQSEDPLIFETTDHPTWMTGVEVSEDGRYLLLTPSDGCDPVNRFYYCELGVDFSVMSVLKRGPLPIAKLIDNFDAQYEYIANEGTRFVFKTNLNAPRYKLLECADITASQPAWKTLVGEHPTDVLEWTAWVNETRLVSCYLHDVKSALELRELRSGDKIADFPLDIGNVVECRSRKEDAEIFYQLTGFLNPGIIYRCDVSGDRPLAPAVFRETPVKGIDPNLMETRQVFVPSKDGTKIPVFIVKRKDVPLDGNNPTLLYGYGGFNISVTPSYSVSRTIFVYHCKGIYAVANIRGGGEYGETWHKAGSLGQKQNCFDDFQACAQFLIDEKYTTPKKIAINGGSNGGLLVGACINQRPDLFGAAIAQVGVMDMLRFHKFTIGHAWTTDYGSSDDPEQFKWLIKYSPVHNVRKGGPYPAVLLMTGDHDDRVVPLHTLKLIAELQHAAPDNDQPILVRVETAAGHGAGKPTKKRIEEAADMFAFINKMTGATWTD